MRVPPPRLLVLALTGVALVLELVPLGHPVVAAGAGLWLVLGGPAVLWSSILTPVLAARDARRLAAVGLAVLTAMLVALLVGVVAALLGMSGLTRPVLAVAFALATGVLAAVDHRVTRPARPVRPVRPVRPAGLVPVATLGAACLLGAVAGPIRLDNGLGSAVAVLALLLIAGLFALLLVRRNSYGDGVVELALYCASAALLLLTSLRGPYLTGHEIQREFRVFELVAALGRWELGSLPDAYHASAAVTVFPVALSRLTGLDGTTVFRVVLPLLFALTPVLLYRATRNVAPRVVALLAAVFFTAFPAFVTDLPFLARREVALLLLACVVLLLTETGGHVLARRLTGTALLAGVVLADRTATLVLLGVLVVAKVAEARPLRRRLDELVPRWTSESFLTWWMVAAVVALAVVWIGPVTRTADQVGRTVTAAVAELRHPAGSRPFARVDPADRLRAYDAATLRQTAAGRDDGRYIPLEAAAMDPATVAPAVLQPLTPLGSGLTRLGIDVPRLQRVLTAVAAGLLAVFLLLGLVRTLFATWTQVRPAHDLLVLALASTVVTGLYAALAPGRSVPWVIQQGLLFAAPFVAIGAVWLFSWSARLRAPAAAVLALLVFLQFTGVLPKVLGGYPPALHLSRIGAYRDLYYPDPGERAALRWVVGRGPVQADPFTSARLAPGAPVGWVGAGDSYPTLVRRDSYVLLGRATVRTGRTGTVSGGDVVVYVYPVGVLDATKNKVYSTRDSAVYR